MPTRSDGKRLARRRALASRERAKRESCFRSSPIVTLPLLSAGSSKQTIRRSVESRGLTTRVGCTRNPNLLRPDNATLERVVSVTVQPGK